MCPTSPLRCLPEVHQSYVVESTPIILFPTNLSASKGEYEEFGRVQVWNRETFLDPICKEEGGKGGVEGIGKHRLKILPRAVRKCDQLSYLTTEEMNSQSVTTSYPNPD
jgi:hypothetical protein